MILNNKVKKIGMIVVSFIMGTIVFASSYMVSLVYNKDKISKTNAVIEESNTSMILADRLKVVLTKRSISDTVSVESSLSVEELKEEEGLAEITEKQAINIFEDKGYKMVSIDETQIVFEKPATTLEPNKYYIGEKDGFISMFKTDEKGIPHIETSDDVSNRSVDSLGGREQQTIKNFERKFDTKDECEEVFSGFVS